MTKRMASLHDYEDHARETLSKPLFDHIMSYRGDAALPTIENEKVSDFAHIKLKLRGMLNLDNFRDISTKF